MIDGSGSISLTRGSGSGSRRPWNIWIRRIRIRIRNTGTYNGKCLSILDRNSNQQFFFIRSQTCFPLRYRTTARHLYSPTLSPSKRTVHRKKRFTSFSSPAGMSLTKLPLCRNNSVMTSLFPPRESLVVTSRLGTGNSRAFLYGVPPCDFLAAYTTSLIQEFVLFVCRR